MKGHPHICCEVVLLVERINVGAAKDKIICIEWGRVGSTVKTRTCVDEVVCKLDQSAILVRRNGRYLFILLASLSRTTKWVEAPRWQGCSRGERCVINGKKIIIRCIFWQGQREHSLGSRVRPHSSQSSGEILTSRFFDLYRIYMEEKSTQCRIF